MERVVVFGGPTLRRHLQAAGSSQLAYQFFPPLSASSPRRDLGSFVGALVELKAGSAAATLRVLREALPSRPVGSVSVRCNADTLRESAGLGFDFHLGSWRAGDPPPQEVLAHLQAARGRATAPAAAVNHAGEGDVRAALARTAHRLSILTDIVKTANSILEPRKVIELIMAKVQELIPCEAWSMLLVDE